MLPGRSIAAANFWLTKTTLGQSSLDSIWPDQYAVLTNFVDEPLSRLQLESLPNRRREWWFVLGPRSVIAMSMFSFLRRCVISTDLPLKTCYDRVELAGLPDTR
jgi:hypothetical protein